MMEGRTTSSWSEQICGTMREQTTLRLTYPEKCSNRTKRVLT